MNRTESKKFKGPIKAVQNDANKEPQLNPYMNTQIKIDQIYKMHYCFVLQEYLLTSYSANTIVSKVRFPGLNMPQTAIIQHLIFYIEGMCLHMFAHLQCEKCPDVLQPSENTANS